MKIRENWSLRFCQRFHVPGVMKIRENWSIWFLQDVPGFMKIRENWNLWFLQGFMYPGSWKLEKIQESRFHVRGVMKIRENWSIQWCENICPYFYSSLLIFEPLKVDLSQSIIFSKGWSQFREYVLRPKNSSFVHWDMNRLLRISYLKKRVQILGKWVMLWN